MEAGENVPVCYVPVPACYMLSRCVSIHVSTTIIKLAKLAPPESSFAERPPPEVPFTSVFR